MLIEWEIRRATSEIGSPVENRWKQQDADDQKRVKQRGAGENPAGNQQC